MREPTVGSAAGAVTIAGLLRARAAERPEQVAFTFLADGEAEGESLTYAELDRKASALAAALAASVPPGERALLLYPPGLDFIAAFFGCLYAGAVAVPAYPPRPNDRSQSRLRAIAHDATPRAALTTAAILAGTVEPRGLLAVAPELGGLRWIATDSLSADEAAPTLEPAPESIAFLQYTSGSTAAPKGVMVTHGNLLHNERMIGAAFGMDEESVVVGWLPLYHDMGLIGNVLQPLHAGGRCVLMSPVAFLQRPMRWLEAVSRYRGTVSGGPNFAYELCLRKAAPEALAGLDLSSWRVAFNGAEPVRASTLERFAEAFAPCGFRREAFYPCYGLAEATLFVTGGHGSRVEQERVSCGRAGVGQRVVIADPETGEERPQGEIWISGPSVARGYWENPEATARDFNAFLPTGEGPFLRTGDLGFLSGGELYVTGRLKDLIILRGRNHYPQDVELTAERSHPDLQPGGGAAFSVEIVGEERLVVVHEVARHRRDGIEEIAEAVRRAVAAEHEVQVHEVVLIRQAGLPKTSSGKVQRRLCRELYLRDELPVVGRSALAAADPAPELAASLTREALAALAPEERRGMLAAYLRERASAAIGLPVGLDQPLTGMGLDSLSAVELKGSVEGALGLAVPLSDLLQGVSVAELADLLLAGLGVEPAVELPPLRAHRLEGDLPLSAGQRGLWFIHQLAPEGGAYNIAVAARVRGLDPAALARALAALAGRHEALRAVFPVVGDEPVQRVLAGLAPDLQVEEAEKGQQGLQGQKSFQVPAVPEVSFGLLARLAEEAWRPFDLEHGPLLRARIFTGPDETVLLLVVHHIVADFTSLAVMGRDLAALYRGEALEPPALRYADYVQWQAELLAGPRGERLWSYWRDRLEGVRDLDLPADHPRPPVQTWRGDARATALPPELVAALGPLAAGRSSTLFMVLLAAFQAQLARYTGQEGFAVGAALAGRPLPELSGLVGYFVNLLPLRADLSGGPGFGEILDQARRTALEGMEHGDYPFSRIAERLRPVRDPARPPLFQTMLVFQRARPEDPEGLAAFSLGEEGARLELGGLALESVRLPERRSQLDLSLFAAEDGQGGVALSLEFNAGLFDGGTAERMLGHLRTLLEGAAAAPETSFWYLPLLSEAERRQVFETWDDTARDYPRGLLLHQLFEAQAARTPDAEAVVSGEARLSYAELNARANRLAHRLRRLGIGPEDRVGVCLRRSERMIVSLFAILKAGGAYVPLDPTYPRERLKAILEDSAARVVIGEKATASRLAEESGERWLSVDEDLAGESAANPTPVAEPSNLAYLIYTSGSTGRPKAVAIEHRSPVVLMHWSREVFPPEELAGTLAATSIGFDVSVFEIFAPLSWGGRIFVVENLLGLPSLGPASEVRLVCGAPSVVAELVRAGRFPSWVRTVNLGGEAVPPALVEGLAAAAPGMRIVNAYGPSEDTTYTTIAFLAAGRPVAIGRPVANTRIYLLDGHGEPVPAGVPGELYIAGEGLSRGYLDRPELTAEKLVPNPFSAEPGARLYRVGDLARRRPDGLLDYLGRIDHQVKIRGFRVELGEIEAALARHRQVREAVVTARDDGDRGRRLVAYVTPRGVAAAELRSFLRESLPEHMVPAAYVQLDALPLSPNGKVDRKALPDPAAAAAVQAPAAPVFHSQTAELLAGLMAEALGVERVDPDGDFFALGGHSLLATRLAARASRLLGVELPVGDVFLHPTAVSLAARAAELAGRPAPPPVRPVPRRPGEGLPLSFAQRRLWFLDRLEPGSPVYHLPGAFRLTGPLDAGALERALAEIARRHEALRTVLREERGEPVQVVQPPPAAVLPRVDLAGVPEAEAARLAREAATAPFDLARGPLFRALLLRRGPEDHELLLTLHHVVADGWSLGILLAELAALYEAFAAGLPSPLPELPVQYADWALWQREREGIDEQVAWWRERLAGMAPLPLPADRPRPAVRSSRGGTRTATLPAAGVEALARRAGATPFMVLLAAFQAQLARYSGVPSVPVGSPVANRGAAEAEGLIGFFVNMLVLRTPVAGDPPFLELLERVREVCLGAYAHQDVPFERLVEELRPERRRVRNPLFQAVFQLEEPLAVERLGAAAVAAERLETGTAKFDLLLSVVRQPEGLAATLEYDADLFDPSTAERLLGHWRALAAGIAANPEAPLSGLLPLTPEEAAQLRALPAGVEDDGWEAPAAGFVAPRTAEEERLAAIWREVLGVERVGVHDDFFALGGHSLLAIRVLSRLHEAVGIDLPLSELFEAPTVAGLAGKLNGPAVPALEPGRAAGEDLPLSLAQQRLWLLDRIEPGSAKYNVPVAVRLAGALDAGLLVRALAEIVRRHEPLRTVYAQVAGEPVQRVLPPPAPADLPLARADLRGLPGPARERELRGLLRAEAARPFDLARGPVARFLLAALGPEEHVLAATFHHIAVDGWSVEVFFRELAAHYGDLQAGRPPSLPEPALRYADWAVWERQVLAGRALDRQIGYWRRQLAGLPELELPTDRPRAAAGDRGASRPAGLPAELVARLRGRGEGITPFAVLLTGLVALLSRLSGQDDLSVGLPAAGRDRSGTEGLIGFFVNTLVARARLADDPGFGALLRRMRDTVLAAQASQDVPFERLVEELQPDRSSGASPLFQVAFTYLASPLASVPMPGLALTLLDPEVEVAKLDLTLSVYEEEGSLRGWVEYRTGLFDPATVERWMGSLRTLLAGAADDPSLPLSELPLLSAAERWQTVAEWNDTGAEQLPDPRLHRLIEAQAARTPGAVAVSFEGQDLTYAEMNARANRIARRLRALGVGPEERVAVSLERSLDLVVALVAVLKAGGAYVPLDPSYPPDRLDYMLEDSGARVLLGRELLGRDAGAIAAGDPADLPDGAGPDDLAYVIYTSGSTGRPKGAMNEHRAIVNRLLWMQDTYRLDATDRVLQKTPMSFDVSVWEFFWPLMTGARLVVARPGGHQDNAYLADLIARERITTLHFVPSMLALWLEEPEVERCRDLRRVVVSGEALALEHERRFFERLPGVELHNLYGPTEAAVDVTWWPCAPGSRHRSVPIGRPIRNVAIHLVDRGLRPVPPGAAGELLIGGVQVGRGYHGRPALTAERFVPDPFSPEPGRRLYRTGDLARRLPDGAVEYLGRIDHQVKIRGVRVELGEVETALLGHPAVAAAAAAVDAERARLVAWLVAKPGVPPGDPEPAALREHLRHVLPEAMIPSLFVRRDALPLTPSGKLDRRALAALPAGHAGASAAALPETPVQALLAGLWSDLLGVEAGLGASFFDLGGHSLLGTQVISRVRELFGVELPLADLFAAPTPAAFARRVAEARAGASPEGPRLLPGPRGPGGDPLSFSQERLWFLQRLEPGSSAYNLPGALRLRGPLRPGALARALQEIARRHESLRTVFREDGGRPVQVVLPPGGAALPAIDLRGLPEPEGEARRLLRAEARRPFDLAAGPLLRASLVRLGEEEHLLAVTMHHIVSDAWSLRVLLRELAALYRAFAAGEPSPLPELPVQYADFARWQREWLAGDRMAAGLAHWRWVLAGAPEVLELPLDRPRPAVPTQAAGRREVALPRGLAADLRTLGRRQGWTPFMVLLAAFEAFLARLTGQRDVVAGAPVANRNRLATEGLIGFFTNTLALRLDLAGDPSFRALAHRARAATLDAYAHQDLPFERLVEELAPRRERGRNPLFQAVLALNDVPPLAELELPGLTAEGVDVETGNAKFDLTLFLAEGGEGLAGHLEYNRDLVDPATAERWAGHLLTLLAGAVAAPDRRLSELPFLTPEERREVLAWSAHVRVFLLDPDLNPVPAGVVGEVHLRAMEGDLPDPFSEVEGWEPGSRLLATGDRARWLAGGEIALLAPATPEELLPPAPAATGERTASRAALEELLARTFGEVLGLGEVGAGDDFFDLGGHSLLATRVLSSLRDRLGLDLPMYSLFEHPTPAGLAGAVEEALAEAAPAEPPIPRAPRDGRLPLSFAQERLWFLDRLRPGETLYNLPLILRLEGDLDAAALAAAFGEIVRRHEALRTVFAEREGDPVQVVLPPAPWELPAVDLSGLPAAAREREAARLAAAEAARPFDLSRGPLLRATLVRLSGGRHDLLLTLHHIVSDGWSMGVLVREAAALYAAALEGRPSPLPELPVQYADFALWQRRGLTGEALARHTGYWRERLRGLPAEIELPADRPRPAVPSHCGGEHRFTLAAGQAAAVEELARREGATPFMVLAAAMLALLSRLSGRGDLAVGTPIANRNRAETEGLIGFFVNTLVLRAGTAAVPGFLGLLRQVRETTLGAYAHQDLPFEKLIDELQPERDPARTPFFQVLLALQNTPLPAIALPGLTLAAGEPPRRDAKFDLTLFLMPAGGALEAVVEYAADLFDPATMVRFAGQWRELLAAAVAAPGSPLAALPLLAAAQRHQIVQEWNDTDRRWEGDPALHQLFERQADLQPEAVAAVGREGSVTYGELEARANRLAHRLRSLDVRRGDPVGLWMERSLDLPAAVLGILKAGALYVPLDAAWPAERVETILAGTAARVLVAGPALLPAVAGFRERLPGPLHVLGTGDAAGAPAERLAPVAGADDPAYLIHTSGSTGAPKGIVVRHRSAANTLRWNNETMGIGPGDRHLFVNSICFDLSIQDLLGMLGAGATLRVADEGELRDPERLAAILRGEGITTWNSAPAALLQLVPFFPPAGEGRSLRRVLLAGDWIPLSLPDRIREAFPHAEIGNFGGATETSVWSSWHPVGAVDPAWASVPYGRPIANTRFYVLDGDLEPCPSGVPGDNYIGGDCPALGYAGQPALTAERFLPDPFSAVPGGRMYSTGDRVRFGPDGVMEFLGRVDFQVKVRGYRIELGEIEAALLRHPGVREAVALAREDAGGEKRLVAYLVPAGPPGSAAPAPAELREALQRTLPEYMVPWSFVTLDRLPVTANGKLDRQALPAPGAAGGDAAAYVAPRNELERAVAAVWREVLGVERVGVHESFFESGGSSLLIVKLHGRLNEALGTDIPILELFRHTTIDALARTLSAAVPAAEEAPSAETAKAEQARERAHARQGSLRQLREARAKGRAPR